MNTYKALQEIVDDPQKSAVLAALLTPETYDAIKNTLAEVTTRAWRRYDEEKPKHLAYYLAIMRGERWPMVKLWQPDRGFEGDVEWWTFCPPEPDVWNTKIVRGEN